MSSGAHDVREPADLGLQLLVGVGEQQSGCAHPIEDGVCADVGQRRRRSQVHGDRTALFARRTDRR